MSFMLAIKAFFKALKEPKLAELFLEQKETKPATADYAHLRMLGMLQSQGRLIDFFKEDITAFSDAQVGACARKIHADCAKFIEESITIRPLMEEEEGSEVAIAPGYDPQKIKLVGKVKGEPPFKGIVIHKGWKAHKCSLPKKTIEGEANVLYSAEVEIK